MKRKTHTDHLPVEALDSLRQPEKHEKTHQNTTEREEKNTQRTKQVCQSRVPQKQLAKKTEKPIQPVPQNWFKNQLSH